jgi:uncharacterized protein (TIGR02246 family)
MSAKIFPTAQDAENAFYEALERADLELMMAVWAEDEDIVCVHPGSPRLTGVEQVRAAWRGMFAGGPHLRVRAVQQVVISGMMVAVHNVHESITVQGEAKPRPPVVATNVYLRSAAGWRMVVHHASPPASGAAAAAEAPAVPPKILH